MNNFVHDFVNFTPVTYTTWNIFTTVPTWAPSLWIWSLTGDWITRRLTRLMNQSADVSEISRRCLQIVGAYRGRVQLAELEHRSCVLLGSVSGLQLHSSPVLLLPGCHEMSKHLYRSILRVLPLKLWTETNLTPLQVDFLRNLVNSDIKTDRNTHWTVTYCKSSSEKADLHLIHHVL